MAILNFTQTFQKSRLSALLHKHVHGYEHEKKSCLLSQFSPERLLSLNGKAIEIHYSDPELSLDYFETGTVLSVLIPSCGSTDMGILFLPDGGSAYYPDPERTHVLFSGM